MRSRLFALLLALLFGGALLSPPLFAQQAGDYLPGELLVGADLQRAGVTPSAEALTPLGSVIGWLPAIRTYRLRLHPGISLPAAIARLRQSRDIAYAEPNYLVYPVATPDDPGYAQQYAPHRIGADLAWEIWTPQRPVVLAVVDTGIDADHPDLANVLCRDAAGAVVGYNVFTHRADPVDTWKGYGHGTWCAGIAAAQINNGIGIAGIAGWNPAIPDSGTYVKVMPVKVVDYREGAPVSGVAEGILWAVDHGAQVISMSFSGLDSETHNRVMAYAWERGCVLVAAAGNQSSTERLYPAACAPVISVAATDRDDRLTSFSSHGAWVKVAAPGDKVRGTNYGGSYITASGTSASAPHVAAEAALLLSQNPRLTNAEVTRIILNHVDPYQKYYGRRLVPGAGRINLFRAVQAAGVGIPELTSITINPARVRGGATTVGTVYLGGPAPEGGRVVALATSDATLAVVPERVTVAEGETAVRFAVVTADVTAAGELEVRATFEGVTRSAPLTTVPLGPEAVELSLADVTGGADATGAVILNGPAPEGGLTLALASSQPSVLVPESVAVPAGATEAAFPVETHPVRSDQAVVITATDGELREEALLMVRSPRVRSFRLSSSTVVGGAELVGTITLTGPAPEGGLDVALSADDAAVTVPPSVGLAAGETVVAFPIKTEPVTETRKIRIVAWVQGYLSTITLTITP
jgi:thermitase